jgi:alpha-L-rhamnosidase
MNRSIFTEKSNWIWTAGPYDAENASIIYFRKELELEQDVKSAVFRISADSRYRLYVNGISLVQGPCKGDNQVWYYDEVELKKVLQSGVNVFAAIVLRYPEGREKGNCSIGRTEMPGFYFEGNITLEDGKELTFGADETWKSFYQDKVKIIKNNAHFDPICITEVAEGDRRTLGWKGAGFNDCEWSAVKAYLKFNVKKAISPGGLSPRPIPFMYEKTCNFESVVCARTPETNEKEWEKLISEQQSLTIPPNTKNIIEISAGVEETAFLETAFIGGKGAKLSVLSSEAYVYEPKQVNGVHSLPLKGDRTDYIKGHLEGFTDTYVVGGYGTADQAEEYEPYWFRTFRFVQITVETGEEPLTVTKLSYRETGYPLEVQTKVETSDESLKGVWDISERTLRRCMHETYEDCPFYEQLQYAMDTRAQILYTYNVSADDRLARKAIDDFFRSQRYDGLVSSCYPTDRPNVIPGFSLYYILMIHDHMMYFGDKKLVEKYMPSVERVIQFLTID